MASRSAPNDTGIYRIRNLIDGKCYVGSAVRFSWRETKHRLHLQRGTHHSRHLQHAWNKDGASAFVFELLIRCDRDDLLFYEQLFLDGWKPEYNVWKQARSAAGVTRSQEFKDRMKTCRTGYFPSAETRRKISDALRGRPTPFLDEHRNVNAVRLASWTQSVAGRAFRKQLGLRRKGVPRSEDIRRKLSAAAARFDADQIRTIRTRIESGEMHKSVASDYGINPSCVSEIARRITYRWVD